MFRSLRLGSVLGTRVYVHWSLLLLLLGIYFYNRYHLAEPGQALLLVGIWAAIFVCVLLHEFGHAFMARAFGIRTPDITLYPIGGVARLERLSERPGEEILIALAGPAVNVAIAGVLLLVVVARTIVLARDPLAESPAGTFLIYLLSANLSLVAFNMLPAFPLDGGRVFRAGLALVLGRLRATEMAARLGALLALLLGIAGLFGFGGGPLGGSMVVFVAGFIFLVGQLELAHVRAQATATRPWLAGPADEVRAVVSVEPGLSPPEPHFSGFTWDRRAQLWIEWREGQPVGACGVSAR